MPESFLTVIPEPAADQTFRFTSPVEDTELIQLPREELLVERNRKDEFHTQRVYLNGDSSTIDTRTSQLVFFPPPPLPVREHFVTIQKWEGHVTDIQEKTFQASLIPIVGEGSDQEAEIYLEEVKPDDRSLIELGSVFYWSIGYLDRPSGRLRASILRFRRLPAWTKDEVDKADAEADDFRRLLDLD